MVMLVAPSIPSLFLILREAKKRWRGNNSWGLWEWVRGEPGILGFAQIGTPIFVKLFYGELYDSIRDMITVVNISQILGLLSAYLFIVVLTFTEEIWQMILQIAHLLLITVLVLIFTGSHGIMGFAEAVLTANTIRVLAVIVLGLWKVKK